MKWKTKEGGWNPYLAGVLVGFLAIASAFITTMLLQKTAYLGASTTFVRAAGLIEQAFSPEAVSLKEYFVETKIVVDWQFMLVVGIALGAFLSSMADKSFLLESVPPLWKERFGPSVMKRALGAFFGGIVAMVGARLADGCPSGHGLSGMMQLSMSAFVALFLFFSVGALVAHIVYKRRAS